VSDRLRARLVTLVLLLLIFAVVPAMLQGFGRSYFYQIANLVLIYALLAASLHLVCGVAGLLHLGHAAFYGVGAYIAALLATKAGWPIVFTLPVAALGSAFIALLVALPTMRLVSIYFAVATLGIGQMLFLVMLNWVSVTKGPNGILLFGGLKMFGYDFSKPFPSYYVVASVVALSIWAIHRLSHSYYGNALRALREDDQCADALGIDTVRLKIEAFVLSAFFAGVAGALWAHTTGYIAPGDFAFHNSILILAMVVVGGLGSLPGALIGAVLLIMLPEVLRDIFGDFRNLMIGLVLFVSILFLPKGLFGEVPALSFARRQLDGAWRTIRGGEGIGWR
jgi:branched-chain amino acid transport system permease protein